MSEFIKREAVMKAFADFVWNSNHSDLVPAPTWNQAVDIVRDFPAADVVEVVRCRECKWWVREGNDSYGYAMFCDHDCSLGGQGIKKPEDYCSHGERKGGSDGAADN